MDNRNRKGNSILKIHDVEQQSREGENNPCFRHGHACRSGRSSEYKSYQAMLARCYNRRNRSFKYYGARGIRVCCGWRKSFQKFLRDMGPKPSPEFSLDRIDPNGSYRKSNCKWSDSKTQRRSRRDSHTYNFAGVYRPLSEIAEFYGLPYLTVWERIHKLGWSLTDAITKPRRKYPNLRAV